MSDKLDKKVSIKLQDHLDTRESVETDDAPALRIYRGDEEDIGPEETLSRQEQIDRQRIEEFWAGRNHAMRRSARSAA